MSKASKAGAIVIAIFALPFLGMGVAAMIAFQSSPQRPGANAATAFAACFVLIGLVLIYGAISGYRKLSAQAKLQAEHPDSPWLWRVDWQQSRTLGQKRNTAVGLWIATVLVGGILSLLGGAILNTKTANDAEAGMVFLCAFVVAEVLLFFSQYAPRYDASVMERLTSSLIPCRSRPAQSSSDTFICVFRFTRSTDSFCAFAVCGA